MQVELEFTVPHNYPEAANYASHTQAALNPKPGPERAIVLIASGLAEYAGSHFARYDSTIGEDGVLGEEWREIARGLLGLLNGECGRLDCGSVDSFIREKASAHGVDLD